MKSIKPKPQPKQIVEIHIYIHQDNNGQGGHIVPGTFPSYNPSTPGTWPSTNPLPLTTC